MGVANPIWLWGLLGLTVPVIIHLLSRKDMRVIRVGSLRHLEQATTRQSIRIHLHAYLLLALRCLIVALVTMIVAGLYLSKRSHATQWLVVEESLERDESWRSVIDSLEAQGYEARRLQPGFPLLSRTGEDHAVPDYWLLAEQLSDLQLDRCVVISLTRLVGFAGERPRQKANISWLSASPDSTRFVLIAHRAPGDSVVMRTGRSNETQTTYETVRLPSNEARAAIRAWSGTPPASDVSSPPNNGTLAEDTVEITTKNMHPVRVVVSGTAIAEEERRVMSAALRAIDGNGILPIEVKEVQPGDLPEADWLIWLSADQPPPNQITNFIGRSREVATTAVTTTTLRYDAPLLTRDWQCSSIPQESEKNEDTSSSADAVRVRNCWVITQPLTVSAAVRGQLTLRLATLLLGDANRKLNRTARLQDQRRMPDTEVFSKHPSGTTARITPSGEKETSAQLLAVLLVALLATERFIANRQQL